MSTLRLGVLLAAVVAGPALWPLVQSGQLDADAGLTRGALVAGACTIGVSWIVSLARGYAAEAEAKAAEEAREQAAEQARAEAEARGPRSALERAAEAIDAAGNSRAVREANGER